MALIDSQREQVIIRIVYDGAPLSGKTTTLHALHTVLKTTGELYSPLEDEGRTQFFDWLEYVGGTFGGRSLACQIVSVPGQPILRQRRYELLSSADVVVFVTDPRPAELPMSLEYFDELNRLLQTITPPPAILLQINKQDVPDALSKDELRLFFPSNLRLTSTVATEHKGVREVFVFAVRLALERLQKMLDSGKNMFGVPDINNGIQLHENLQSLECIATEADQVLQKIFYQTATIPSELPRLAATVPAQAQEKPAIPAIGLPQHWVFPAGHGHEIIAQIAATGMRPQRHSDGTWIARDNDDKWRCYSHATWCYANETEATHALRAQIRTHIRLSPILSCQRVVAIDHNGQGQWRLWQITPSGTTLAHLFKHALQHTHAADFAQALVHSAHHIEQALQLFSRHAPHIPATLETIRLEDSPVYIGLLETPPTKTQIKYSDSSTIPTQVHAIFADPVGFVLAENNLDPLEVLSEIHKLEHEAPLAVAILIDLFTPYTHVATT
jgi:hypothetical protein